MSEVRSKFVVRQRLFEFLRKLDSSFGVDFPVSFEPIGSKFANNLVLMFPRPDSSGIELDVTIEEWNSWAANAVIEWWSLSKDITHRALVNGQEVVPTLLNHPSNLLYQGSESVYLRRSGGPPLIYFMDDLGVHGVDYLNPIVGGTVCVYKKGGVTPEVAAEALTQLTVRRTTSYDATFYHQSSQSRFSKLLIEEVKRGAHHNIITDIAHLLRVQLPRLKAGVPSIKDVQSKLEMESKLRLSEAVTGSLRPLVFTLHALEGSDPEDINYPGLWLFSESIQQVDSPIVERDIREFFRVLLLWDSLVHFLAAALRFHGDFKSGLIYSKEDSRTVYAPERRYSKRDGGEVESAYLQVNPLSIQGNSEAISLRLIQFATHELAHLGTYSNIGHSESFHNLKESFQNQAADHFSVIKELVELSGLSGSRYGAKMKKPIAIDAFIAEIIQYGYGVPVSFLAGRWAALRNISLNKAELEVLAGVEEQSLAGRISYNPIDRVVLPI